MSEAIITINGRQLTIAQSMAVRCAVVHFAYYVVEPDTAAALGPIADAYHARLSEIQDMLIEATT